MIEAVIFDMDGLLIDSEPHWRESHRAVLAQYGHTVTENDVRAAAGKRTGDQVKIWQERFNFQTPSVGAMTEEIVDGVIAAIHTHGEPMAGVDELIQELHKHHIPMAVASSSSERLINVVLERLSIRQYMRAVHSGENEVRGKPFPDVFLSTAKSIGIAATNCLVFEDSLNGVKAAKAASMKCIAVPEEPYDKRAFEAAQPDRIISSLEEIHWSDIQSL
jgi:sugar-phosphatase